MQSDGRIVVVGDTGGDLAVARYTTGGILDTTFDSDGYLTTKPPQRRTLSRFSFRAFGAIAPIEVHASRTHDFQGAVAYVDRLDPLFQDQVVMLARPWD